MRLRSYCVLLVVTAVALQEAYAVVWESKPSPSGVRGRGQISPVVYELGAQDLQQELVELAETVRSSGRSRRQSDDSGIGYTARLENDNHYQAVVHWTGHPSEAIFIVTRKVNRDTGHSDESWLWRSTDYGHTFVNETDKLPSTAVVEWYYISPYSEYLVFTDIKLNQVYITVDEGESYSNFTTPFTPNRILFQSTLAPQSTEEPYNKYILGYDNDAATLWVSSNLGQTWDRIGASVPPSRYFWRRLDTSVEGDLTTVYFEQVSPTNSNNSLLYYWHAGMQSGALFNPNLGEFRLHSFVLEYEYMFVQKPETVDVARFLSPLWVSYQRSTEFTQAGFPFITDKQHYAVVDASEGQVFIAVYHIGNTSNLYISEERGLNYSLTLQDIVSPPENDWITGNPTIDVHVVEGIVGTYFANRHAVDSSVGSTVVSFDKGGLWTQLSPPALDYQGLPVICAPPECSLHLHMDIDAEDRSYQTILSQDSAIGLIMAQGNLGGALSSSTRDARLYFSRDGGFTWAEVRSGVWEFQFAALGSVVVAVQKRARVNQVLWTCDEGASWNTSRFVDSSFPFGIVVIGMRTENGEKSRHVTVFGYDIFGGFHEWLVFDLNFTAVVPRQCDPEQDYTDWIPTDERPGSRCLLGEVIAYERRNASECCFVDPNYEKGTDRNACECAIEDFECDFNFERDNLNSPCNPYPGLLYPPAPPDDCPEGENYTYSSGYRKIAGDRCIPGRETYFFPVVRDCPIKPPRFLVIDYNPRIVKYNTQVDFQLLQFDGARLSTEYTWDFGDGNTATLTGFSSASSISHSYSHPGVYKVNITASNEGGSSDTVQTVTVLDELKSVSIAPPSQLYNNEVPTSIALLFKASLTSSFGSDQLGVTDYQWSFGDGATSTGPQASHTYDITGHVTVTLLVHAPFVANSAEDRLSITVYKATSRVEIVSQSNLVKVVGGASFVFTESPVEFMLDSVDSIPPDTTYSWHVVKHSPDSSAANSTGDTQNFSYAFPSWGMYVVSVIGRSSHSGSSFSGDLPITAEANVLSVTANHKQTSRVDTVVPFFLSVWQHGNQPYQGPLTIYVSINDTGLASSDITTSSGEATLNVGVLGKGPVEFTVTAGNAISLATTKTTVYIVGSGEYAELSIKFSNLPPQYNDSAWQDQLLTSVKVSVTKLLLLDEDLLEILGVRVVMQNDTQVAKQDSNNFVKREAVKLVPFVYVDFNILPVDSSASSIDQVFMLGHLLVTDAKNGSLVVTVDGQILTISSASSGGGGIIIEPPIIIDTFDPVKYGAIGGALGVFVLLAITITVTLVLVTYFYRRKYNRLNVRYSRLQQTPVRFTFTAGGEMVEESDEDNSDTEMESDTKPF